MTKPLTSKKKSKKNLEVQVSGSSVKSDGFIKTTIGNRNMHMNVVTQAEMLSIQKSDNRATFDFSVGSIFLGLLLNCALVYFTSDPVPNPTMLYAIGFISIILVVAFYWRGAMSFKEKNEAIKVIEEESKEAQS